MDELKPANILLEKVSPLYCLISSNDNCNISIVKINNKLYELKDEKIKVLNNFNIDNLDSYLVINALTGYSIVPNVCDFMHIGIILNNYLSKYKNERISKMLINEISSIGLQYYLKYINDIVMAKPMNRFVKSKLINVVNQSDRNMIGYTFTFENKEFYDMNFSFGIGRNFWGMESFWN